MPYCKVCGHELGPPDQDLHDPEGLSDVAQELGGPIENEEEAHVVVRDGKRGWRYYCTETGKTTSLVDVHPDEIPEEEEGEGAPAESSQNSRPKQPQGPIYDFTEEKEPEEVLLEVLQSGFIGLNEAQLEECLDWASDYDGQLPPDILEDVLGNMDGVSNQTAALARQKYEVKLNKWVRQQTQQQDGPPIGISSHPSPSTGGRRSRSRGRGGQQQQQETQEETETEDRGGNESIPKENLISYRRGRRTVRRNNALDTAAQEAAQQIANEAAHEIAKDLGRYFGLPAKILEAKAEKDPDWFFEKMEQLDIDLMEFLEPSEARKEELKEEEQNQVDAQADNALERVQTEETEQEQSSETVNSGPPEEDGEGLFDEPEEYGSENEKEAFEEQFGDLEQPAGEQ